MSGGTLKHKRERCMHMNDGSQRLAPTWPESPRSKVDPVSGLNQCYQSARRGNDRRMVCRHI